MGLFVDDARFGRYQQTAIPQGFRSASFRADSFRVIPGTIPAEFEFRSKFRRNQLINLAGPSAKFDSSGIPGIARILPDSGRNQWRTIKTSTLLHLGDFRRIHSCFQEHVWPGMVLHGLVKVG